MKKVVWAVDPFEPPSEIRRSCEQALKCLAAGMDGLTILPRYVLAPVELNLTAEFVPPLLEQYIPAAEEALRKAIQGVDVRGLGKSQVILQAATSRRQQVEYLDRYAQEVGADLILVGTHARRGISRLVLGSFAESLILHSKTPVLVLGPSPVREDCFQKILFPTDLGSHSRKLFEGVVGFAREMGSSITILHCAPNPFEPVIQSGLSLFGGTWVPVYNYFSEEAQKREKLIEAWARWARRKGVAADPVVHLESERITDVILSRAREGGYGLIAMAARSGPIAATIIGSVTRQVVRSALCPVWILHPQVL